MGHEDNCSKDIEASQLSILSFLFKREFAETQKLIVDKSNGFNLEENYYELLNMLQDCKLSGLIRQILRMAALKPNLLDKIIMNVLNLEVEMIDEALLCDCIRQDANLFA